MITSVSDDASGRRRDASARTPGAPFDGIGSPWVVGAVHANADTFAAELGNRQTSTRSPSRIAWPNAAGSHLRPVSRLERSGADTAATRRERSTATSVRSIEMHRAR